MKKDATNLPIEIDEILKEEVSPTKQEDGKSETFLTELQQEGRGTGKIELGNFEQAIDAMFDIVDPNALAEYKKMPESEWPAFALALYCHDCHQIVPPGEIKKIKGRSVVFCGVCRSKKLSKGKEASLRRFYNVKNPSETSDKNSKKN